MVSSKMLALLSVLLLSSHVLPLVQSKPCDDKTEYFNEGTCCKKCKPGEYLMENCYQDRPVKCGQCPESFFTDEYNSNFNWCKDCKTCTKNHMKYKKNCTSTSNAVCTCVEGYRCRDSECKECEKIQTPIVPSPAPPTKTIPAPPTKTIPASTTKTIPAPTSKTIHPTNDVVWISVSLCCACVCVCALLTCFLLISRHARKCGWIISTSPGPWRRNKSNSGSSQCTEEEEVPMPVQEMCGKTEKLEDV